MWEYYNVVRAVGNPCEVEIHVACLQYVGLPSSTQKDKVMSTGRGPRRLGPILRGLGRRLDPCVHDMPFSQHLLINIILCNSVVVIRICN